MGRFVQPVILDIVSETPIAYTLTDGNRFSDNKRVILSSSARETLLALWGDR